MSLNFRRTLLPVFVLTSSWSWAAPQAPVAPAPKPQGSAPAPQTAAPEAKPVLAPDAPALKDGTISTTSIDTLFYFDLISKNFEQGKTRKDELPLRMGEITAGDLIERTEATALSAAHYRVRVPILAKDNSVELVVGDTRLEPTVRKDFPGKRVFLVEMTFKGTRECKTLVALDAKLQSAPFELCAYLSKDAYVLVGANAGAFAFRNKHSYWAQAGLGFVTQTIDNPGASSSAFNSNQGALRVGAGGMFWHHFDAEAHFRQSAIKLGGASFRPQWTQFNVGYGFELPSFSHVTPHVILILGFELYRNLAADDSAAGSRYLKSYRSPAIGFRSRFAIFDRTELGGDLIYTHGGDTGGKFFIQGDVRYWLKPRWAVGAGYWIDRAHIISKDVGTFSENSYAIESYVRYNF